MIWTIIFAILIFSLIIFVHELGHFLTARLFKVKVHEFAIGMGPKIRSWVRGETEYSIRAFPMGGFCSMEGEDAVSDDEGSFSAKKWYQRLIILAAGATMNVLLGFLICILFVSVSADRSGGIATTTVDSVMEKSSLYDFLQPGDKIVAINGERVNIKRDITFYLQRNGLEEGELTIKRGEEAISVAFTPYEEMYEDGTPGYYIGFNSRVEKPGFFRVLHESVFQTVWMGKMVFVSLGMLLRGSAKLTELSGPVGVVSAMNETAKPGGIIGFLGFIHLASFISVNIGIMNLLPIPALDGGRILFVLVEAIRRKPLPPEKEGVVHFIGLVLLMGLMVFATWNDIMRLITG